MMEHGVWRAPGRANLMGEHTDYNEGLVLPFALALGVTATATARDDGLLVLSSRQTEEVASIPLDSLEPGTVSGWTAYPAGVAWALLSAGHRVRPASIEVDSDLPQGAGLSSSAALECAVALALTALAGQDVPRRELAEIVRRAENDFVGVPVGLMDQSASLLGRAGHALLLDCRTLATSDVPFSPADAGAAAVIVNTRAQHALTGGEFAQRQAECAQAARQLGVAALGHLTEPGDADRIADPLLRRRARHVISDDARVRTVVGLLCRTSACTPAPPAQAPTTPASPARPTPTTPAPPARPTPTTPAPPARPTPTTPASPADAPAPPAPLAPDISDIYRQIGEIMVAAHVSLRDDFEVSWPEANAAAETALAEGALGARMIGGGFGGSVLLLVPEDRRAPVCEAIADAYRQRGWPAPEFIDATPSASAARLR